MKAIEMVDLKSQYRRIQPDIDRAILDCLAAAEFINGPAVKSFQSNFAAYLGAKHVIPCANGTDALQIAFMGLNLRRGDEVIVPAFTYVATAEVIALLGLKPVMVDADGGTFNVTAEGIEKAITPRTKAIVPVHLFGQVCPMESIMELAKAHGLFVVEDNAQAIGADYRFTNGDTKKAGTIGHVGCTSFFPSKNLGCFGDGGAVVTNDDDLAERIRIIANHGQAKKYYHSVIGVNSRLDTIQAAILDVKLMHLDEYCHARQKAASIYDKGLSRIPQIMTPLRHEDSTHVFHQYTLRVRDGCRDSLKEHLRSLNIPSMVYYPLPLYRQEAFSSFVPEGTRLSVTEDLCGVVLSLPMHTELDEPTQNYIIDSVVDFFSSPRLHN